MPQVTVYIREQDLEKWKALPRKSEFISNALNKEPARAAVQPKVTEVHSNGQPVIRTKEDVLPTIKQLFPDAKVIEPLYRDKKNKKL